MFRNDKSEKGKCNVYKEFYFVIILAENVSTLNALPSIKVLLNTLLCMVIFVKENYGCTIFRVTSVLTVCADLPGFC